MKLIFSRKGFDSGSGGGPSPIVDGRPVTLPIPVKPANDASRTRYCDIGLGGHVCDPTALCHHDPFFVGSKAALGQSGAAQGHLRNQGVGIGDVFLFFGLFAGDGQGRHHRIFGYLEVEEMVDAAAAHAKAPAFAPDHPHFLNPGWRNNIVYVGRGQMALRATDALRLSVTEGRVSRWQVPGWLAESRDLSFHGNPARWLDGNRLQTVGRGQEFVTDISGNAAAWNWLAEIKAEIEKD